MRRPTTLLAFALSLAAASVAPAYAQSRDQLPVIVPDPDAEPSRKPPSGDKKPNDPGRPGGSIGGLPDAVTVLDILRRLPHFPPRGDQTGDDDVDRSPPFIVLPLPQSSGEPETAPPLRRRVVTIPSNAPFKPSLRPRQPGAGPGAIGAIVPEVREREVLVTLGAGADANTVFELSQDLGLDGETLYASALLGARVVRFRIPDTRSIADVVQQLSTDARVEDSQPNYVFSESQSAAKPLPVPQYAPDKLHLGEAHKIARGKRIKVAVIDTALDAAHPALAGAIAGSFDALGETKGEAEAHGTAIAGIVGARKELTGVAPAAEVLSIRAFAKSANGPAQSHTLALLKGLDWSVLQGARVINMSFAGPDDPLLHKAIDAAIAQGVVVVAAAGNGGPNAKPAYPAAFPNVIGVTATDQSDATYKDANRGAYIAVAAPGVDIIAAAPNGAYDISSGTSMAAAHVSGVAALLLEKNPKLTPAEIRERLSRTARAPKGGSTDDLGAGIVDAEKALQAK